VAGGGEAGHAGARLGEQVPGGGDADPGDLIELGDLGGERAMASPIRVVRVLIWAVSASVRASIMPSMNAW
jgi:hypothetical protein